MVRGLFPEAEIFFMHTVKSRKAIREAYSTYGVRNFSLDSQDELDKILAETGNAADLSLHIRLAIPNSYAELALTDKFGAVQVDAVQLLQQARAIAHSVGVCFHVGSQSMHPDAYRLAIKLANQVVKASGISIDTFDVGGGFPSIYPGMTPPPMHEYFEAIHDATRDIVKEHGCTLLAEPGRALVAESGSVLVRVELRKGNFLYINDGTYGSLFDAGQPKWLYPCKLLNRKAATDEVEGFSFYGPTCDTMDFMKGPFMLPADIKEGDYIEIGQLGAYGRTMATRFNGFAPASATIAVKDEPLMTIYETPAQLPQRKVANA